MDVSIFGSLGLSLDELISYDTADWPCITKKWLENGMYSEALREFSELTPDEGWQLSGEMYSVLRSLGLEIRSMDQLLEYLSNEFEIRCKLAFRPVIADLRASGHDDAVGVGLTTPDGNVVEARIFLADGGSTLSRPRGAIAIESGIELICHLAEMTVATLGDIEKLSWPKCRADHGRVAMPRIRSGAAVWWCETLPFPYASAEDGHVLSVIGELTSGLAV